MTRDPVRWLETEQDGTTRAGLLRAAAADAPPERLRAQILATGAAASGLAAAGAGRAAALGKASLFVGAKTIAWASAVLIVAGAVVGVVGGAARSNRAVEPHPPLNVPSRSPERQVAPTEATTSVPPIAAPATPRLIAPASTPVNVTTPSRPAPSAPAGLDLLKELAIVDGARSRLAAGDAAGAIRELDRHDLDYLHGQLAPDALALRIDAYLLKNDLTKVAELSQGFLARYADHPQAPRVRKIVADLGTAGGP